jgi:hypothetical protein
MADGVTVDACIVRQYDKDVRTNVRGPATDLIERITAGLGFAVDEGRKIEHEWLTTCQGPFLKEWFIAQLSLGRIRTVIPAVDAQHKKKIVLEFGFPRRGYDLVYIGVANVTTTKYVVTGDMDFYDPTLKAADDKAKVKAREDRCGPVCKYLKTQMGIRVGTVLHALAELP